MVVKLMYFVAGTAVGLAIGTLIVITQADDEDEGGRETRAMAAEAQVDPLDLAGAVVATGLAPRDYLYMTGELERPTPPPPTRLERLADCIIAKESGGLDIPNRQGSGATGPGQYFPSTWARHLALYRQATGFVGALSLHSLQDVRHVMAWILSAIPSTRREWSVGGC